MITSQHAGQELQLQTKKYKEAKNIDDKLDAIFKLVQVGVKLLISIRINTVAIMKTVGAKLLPPRRRETTPEKTDGTQVSEDKEAPQKTDEKE